jgi:tRNA(fMet)-specific endonuclease VapC
MILDTDIMSILAHPRCPQTLVRKLQAYQGLLYTTAINWAEISYGLARQPKREWLRTRYEQILLPVVTVLPFDSQAAEIYGSLRTTLEVKGEPLADFDLMIAAVALQYQLPLVTGNLRHFERIPGLQLENWLE